MKGIIIFERNELCWYLVDSLHLAWTNSWSKCCYQWRDSWCFKFNTAANSALNSAAYLFGSSILQNNGARIENHQVTKTNRHSTKIWRTQPSTMEPTTRDSICPSVCAPAMRTLPVKRDCLNAVVLIFNLFLLFQPSVKIFLIFLVTLLHSTPVKYLKLSFIPYVC